MSQEQKPQVCEISDCGNLTANTVCKECLDDLFDTWEQQKETA